MRQLYKYSLLIIFLITQQFGLAVQAEDNQNQQHDLFFGVHPYLHASTLVDRFTPLMDYLGSQLGRKIHIRVGSSYQDHIEAVTQGKVDFAYFGPAAYIKLTEQKDYIPLGRLSFSGKNTFRGAIITRKDSNLTSMQQLRGKKFAFGDPISTLSRLIPERMLNDAGIKLTDLYSFSTLTNHHNVALSVLLGQYDAGGVKEEVFREYESRGLKALTWSPEIPTHLFIANPSIPEKQIHKLSQLLQTLHQHPAAAGILQSIKKGTTAIIPAHDDEYDNLRKLISGRKRGEN